MIRLLLLLIVLFPGCAATKFKPPCPDRRAEIGDSQLLAPTAHSAPCRVIVTQESQSLWAPERS